MTWNDLLKQCAAKTGTSKQQLNEILSETFGTIADKILEGDRVIIANFGVFYPAKRKSRRVRHPSSKQIITLPEIQSIGFRTNKSIKR